MQAPNSSYRPHDPGHNYYAPGIYLITLVVRNRREQCTLFGKFNDELSNPSVCLSEMGKAVMEEWNKIPSFEQTKGRHVRVLAATCMPEHFHGVIEVLEPMDASLGQVIWGFKVACTKRWRAIALPKTAGQQSQPSSQEQPQPSLHGQSQPSLHGQSQPSSQEQPQPSSHGQLQPSSHGQPQPSLHGQFQLSSQEQPSLVALQEPLSAAPNLHLMSRKQRAEYYALHPEAQQPLWDDNYDDTICLNDPVNGGYSQRHLTAMIRYVNDNARRAIIRRLRPQYMQRCLHVRIAGRDYAAFGNLFLLRWARKVQVFCHRKASDGRTPYETTPEYLAERQRWEAMVMAGGTVIVTPGISRGESLMKEHCIEHGLPLIHIQKEAIGSYWKPEEKRFNACASGMLLILAPWRAEHLGTVNGVPSNTDYSIFHNLNRLAESICSFDGEATIIAS